ncbi:MAG: MFS transporter [Holosporaceae bacterium]|jgi:MFS family permease|nr:MFS transporter [Holosporaceae bacterium]
MVTKSTKEREGAASRGGEGSDGLWGNHCDDGFFFALRNLPSGVFAISLFGLFLGTSTTMVYSQLSLFLKNELGASTADVTLLDGLVEGSAFVVRVFAGPVSDFLKERKGILFAGCFITLCARFFLGLVSSWGSVLLVQFSERVGNGVQATPRDALIADLSPSQFRGRSFGFSRSLKTVGSFLGTLIAVYLMVLSHDNYKIVFGCAVIPVIIAFFCLLRVKTPKERQGEKEGKIKPENPFKRKYLKSMDATFWKIILLALISEMGHFSEHTFPIYAQNFLATSLAGTVSSFISLGQVLMSFPIGIWADRYGREKLIACCMILMVVANCFFLSAKCIDSNQIVCVYAGAFLWGGQMTAVQGLFLSRISEHVDRHLRATAIGIYSLMLGIAYLAASCISGRIWDHWGSSYSFLYSISWSCIALCLFRILLPTEEKRNLRHT